MWHRACCLCSQSTFNDFKLQQVRAASTVVDRTRLLPENLPIIHLASRLSAH
jgi:hypothetical protein